LLSANIRMSVCRTRQMVYAYVKGPPKLGSAWVPPPYVWAWLTPRNTPLRRTCYSVEFGRSGSNGTNVINEIRRKNLTSP